MIDGTETPIPRGTISESPRCVLVTPSHKPGDDGGVLQRQAPSPGVALHDFLVPQDKNRDPHPPPSSPDDERKEPGESDSSNGGDPKPLLRRSSSSAVDLFRDQWHLAKKSSAERDDDSSSSSLNGLLPNHVCGELETRAERFMRKASFFLESKEEEHLAAPRPELDDDGWPRRRSTCRALLRRTRAVFRWKARYTHLRHHHRREDMTREASARYWLRITTRLHAGAGAVLLFVSMIANIAFREASALSVSSHLQHSVTFRLCSLAAVILAAKSCKGRRMYGTKVLKKIPRLLCAKAVDVCASMLVWLTLAPLLFGYDSVSSAAALAVLFLFVAVSCFLDTVGLVVSWCAIRQLCSSLPEIAVAEADAEDDVELEYYDEKVGDRQTMV
ncbi:hypothetical protein CTAYLR_006161 [Chrysophaeum taylorii]|uniref:Transmembrane protein n=1 Tax=Chrysophaeum taylorii TaxID=2483200 RepID=A0AAD7XN92_9STRA|nr:hypothetical protein CTAYLR_006161 [Chrysophaeum taylorii]